MSHSEFCSRITNAVKVGMVFPNPGGGASTVVRVNEDRIVYLRGHTRIPLLIDDLYRAFTVFAGQTVTTRMLKDFDHSFDSAARNPAGHSCNCTFAFQVLRQAGLAGEIMLTRPMSQDWIGA